MRSSILLTFIIQFLFLHPNAYAEESNTTQAQDRATFSFSLTDLTDPLAKWSNQRLLAAIAKPEAMSYELAPYVWSIASRWVRSNQWAGRVRVNAPVDDKGLNIYVVQRKFLTANGFSNLEAVCPCQYLVGTNSIICVDDALKRAIVSLDRYTKDADDPNNKDREAIQDIRRQHRTFMSEWIVGHELGHLVLGHSLSDLRRSWTLGGSQVGLDAERQADLFYLSSLQHQNFSQFSSIMGLSQLMTAEYAEALEKQNSKEKPQKGEIRVFAANNPVKLKVSAFEHPPMLFRALNLYKSLLSRYPNMVDSSGYVDRISAQATPIGAPHADPPAFCQPVQAAAASADGSLDSLLQYADFYVYEGAESWARSVVARMRDQIEASSSPDASKALWRSTVAHLNARIDWKFKKVPPDWQAFDAFNVSLDSNGKQLASILFEMTKSFVGSRTSAQEGLEAAERTEIIVKELISKKALTVENDDDVFDVLSTYLVLSFVPHGELDEKYFKYIDQVVGRIANLKNLSPIRRRIAVDMLRTFALSLAAKGEPQRFAVVRVLSLLVTISSSFAWPFEEIDYRVSEVGFLKQYFTNQHPVIANREISLGQMLPRWGQSARALEYTQDGLKEIEATDLSQASENDRARILEWKLKVKNDIAWLLINNGKYDEAIPILQTVLQSRKIPTEKVPCNSEVLHVIQNLADAYLAVGNWTEAIKFGQLAYSSCAGGTPLAKEWYDAAKTLGLAMFSSGQIENAQKVLREYLVTLSKDLDDNQIPRIVLTAVANGKQVSVSDAINVEETIQTARKADHTSPVKK